MQNDDLIKTAKKRALYLLGGRDYSKTELLNKLCKNYPEDISLTVLDWVCELGYINDTVYAEKLAKKLIQTKNYGIRKVRYEMKMRGLDSMIIDSVLMEYDNSDLQNEIIKLIEKKYRDKLNDYKERGKVINTLVRRGYDYDDIKICIGQRLEIDDWNSES